MLATARVATGSWLARSACISPGIWCRTDLEFSGQRQSISPKFDRITQAGDALWTGGAFGPEAGLLGCIACETLTGLCLVWGKTKLTSTRSLSNLVRYRRRPMPPEYSKSEQSRLVHSKLLNVRLVNLGTAQPMFKACSICRAIWVRRRKSPPSTSAATQPWNPISSKAKRASAEGKSSSVISAQRSCCVRALDVQLDHALAKLTNPIGRIAVLPMIANVELHAHPWRVEFIHISHKLFS